MYNPNTSTQLEWMDTDIQEIIIKSLEPLGINLRAEDISAWSQAKSEGNFLNLNRI